VGVVFWGGGGGGGGGLRWSCALYMDNDLLHAAWLFASLHFFRRTSESEGERNSAMQEDVF